jgi:hypothetical protein
MLYALEKNSNYYKKIDLGTLYFIVKFECNRIIFIIIFILIFNIVI